VVTKDWKSVEDKAAKKLVGNEAIFVLLRLETVVMSQGSLCATRH
jgi:hypothetical protein